MVEDVRSRRAATRARSNTAKVPKRNNYPFSVDVVGLDLQTTSGAPGPRAQDWRIRVLSIATAVVFLAGVVAAFAVGTDDGGRLTSAASAEDAAIVGLAGQRLDEVSSYRMEMRFGLGDASATMQMELASQTLGRMTLELPGEEIEAFFEGQRIFAPAARGSSGWILFESAQELDSEQAAGLVGSDALSYLKALAGDEDIEVLGTEEVRDVEATHYRAQTTFERLNAQTPEELRDPELEAIIDQLPESVSLDLWISADGLPRRMDLEYQVQDSTFRVQIELFDFGAPIEVVLPAPESVIETRTSASFVELRRSLGLHLVALTEP